MNEERKETIENYEKVYGKTSPIPCPHLTGYCPEYAGCQIREGNIVISFSSRLSNDTMSDIEGIFRNRLGRKISFTVSDCEFTVFVYPIDKEDAGEYLVAAQVLDRCYRGKEQALEQKAEYSAYLAKEDWRDPEVVKRYLAAIYAGK